MKVGIDIVDIEDFKNSKNRIEQGRFIKWVFTHNEIEYCKDKIEADKCYAGKFAAKESMMKAMYNETCVGLKLSEYEILNDENGKPYVNGYENALVSVSYTDKYVIAVVIIE